MNFCYLIIVINVNIFKHKNTNDAAKNYIINNLDKK